MNIRNGTNLGVDEWMQKMHEETANALGSFRTLPDHKKPRIISGYGSINDLPFERF